MEVTWTPLNLSRPLGLMNIGDRYLDFNRLGLGAKVIVLFFTYIHTLRLYYCNLVSFLGFVKDLTGVVSNGRF